MALDGRAAVAVASWVRSSPRAPVRSVAAVVAAPVLVWGSVALGTEIRPITLHAAHDACPSGDLVKAELDPLLVGVVTRGEPVRAMVRDEGDRYVIEIDAARRVVEEPERDCLERARVAAVFIAMNAPAPPQPPTAQPPQAASPPIEMPAPTPVPSEPSASWRYDAELGFAVSTAVDARVTAPGVGFGMGAATSSLRIGGMVGWLAPMTFDRTVADHTVVVELDRLWSLLAAGPRAAWGDWELWPRAGLAAEVLRFRGRRVEAAQASARFNVGFDAGARLSFAATSRFAGTLDLSASWFPRSYTMRVEPGFDLAETPHLLVGARLGFAMGSRH